MQLLLFAINICFLSLNLIGETENFDNNVRQRQRTAARYMAGKGIGYNSGYSTFECFWVPDPKIMRVMPFLDLRGHIFDKGKIAANSGIGFRTIAGCRAYGLNIYYDYRNTDKQRYNQLGFGFETLGRSCDFRINGYLPVGKKITDPYQSKFAEFAGNYMLLSQNYQFAMKGVNAELGLQVGKTNLFDFYAALGPYHFTQKDGPKVWGGKARLTCKVKDYLTLELSNSYDNYFHNRFQFQVTLTIPFGRESQEELSNRCDRCDYSKQVLCDRMTKPVERQEIIVVGYKKQNQIAVDSVTGEPIRFIFVDNRSNSLGTYESPYPTLIEAQNNSKPGDIIYVFAGDGTTRGMSDGIVLQPQQKFWGAGNSHLINTTQGQILIPAQGGVPNMTNTTGNGVTLTSLNQVDGFNLTDVLYNGIFGTDLDNIEISNCVIDNSTIDQISLQYSGANGILNLHDLTIKNGQQRAVYIDSTANVNNCKVQDCLIQDNLGRSIDATFANQANFDMLDNTIKQNVNGNAFTFNGSANLLVTGNTISETASVSDAPITVITGASPVDVVIKNNMIDQNTCGALRFALDNTDAANLVVSDNIISNNGTGASAYLGSALLINANTSSTGNCHLDLANNSFLHNAGSAIYCTNGEFNNFEVSATDNTITNNGGAGFVFNNPCNQFVLNATNNIISGGGDHGIALVVGSPVVLADLTIVKNQIIDNTGAANGIVLSYSGTDLNLVIDDNNISNNNGTGIVLYSSDTIANLDALITNNIISSNQNAGSNAAAGIDLEQFTNFEGTIENNTILDNTGLGVYVGSTVTSPWACLDLSGNNCNTNYSLVNDIGIFNLAPCNFDTVNTGSILTTGTITVVQSCPDATVCS